MGTAPSSACSVSPVPQSVVCPELFFPFAKKCVKLKKSLSLGSCFSSLLHPLSVASLGVVGLSAPPAR